MKDSHELSGVDLNLLVAFDAIAREASVSRAAARAGVTQSAMSHTLRRLRELFDDPLFVRGRGGLVPTPRAAALMLPVRGGLVALSRALAGPEAFEPQRSDRTFRMVAPDLFEVLALPALMRRLRSEAPNVDLAVLPVDWQRLAAQLETGEVDVAIQVVSAPPDVLPGLAPQGLVRRVLFREGYRCFVRADHPALADGGLSLERYLALPHAMVSPSGERPGLVDAALAELGHTRRVALRLPHFGAAPAFLAHSDLVLTAPAALARVVDASIAVVAPPLTLPEHAVTVVWHERYAEDPGHRWFRDLVVASARTAQQPA